MGSPKVALGTLGAGGAGYAWGVRATEEAVAYASVEIREVLRQAGAAEADNDLYFGAAAGILPLLAGVGAVFGPQLVNRRNPAQE